MKKGFTLVELSIVLVIIGLLIGGILVAQSMVSTTKITKTVRQLSLYDAAIANFQTKFKQLPGDSNLFPNPGNNDGNIIFGETSTAWTHLSLGVGVTNADGTNFIDWSDTYTPRTGSCPVLAIPSNQIGFLCPMLEYAHDNGQNFRYRLQIGSPGAVEPDDSMPWKAGDTAALDLKIDDGIAFSGRMVIYEWGSAVENAHCWTTGGVYLVADTTWGCMPWIDVGIASAIDKVD